MAYRLRYLQHDLELSEGTFAVGRSTSCQLSLDDPLVSRRHAVLEVRGDSVTLEDLESRNGVLVNGERIEGRVQLAVGDRVLIGSQELTLLTARDAPGGAGLGRMTLPKMQAALTPLASRERASSRPTGERPSSRPGERGSQPGERTTHPGDRGSRPADSLSDSDPEPSMVRRVDQFKLLGGVAEKAFAMGRTGEAERLLAPALGEVIEACRAGKPLPPTLVDQAARFSSKLATATGKGGWADYVIELYFAQERACPAGVIDELYSAMRKVASVDLAQLRAYINLLRSRAHRFGPAERFLLQRLEGLERVAALK